jgi:Fe-S cluster biogenesis protein NfuA/nitrite reductase/ring-hydroxylating ferredoxin subunit
VSSLLLLHGLHPLDLETRVAQALEQVRPYMRSHGGGVDLLEITGEGVIRLRLEGTCHGCPSSRVTLKFAVEKAIYAAAPDAAGLEVEGSADGASAHSQAGMEGSGEGWIDVPGLAGVNPGTVRVYEISGQNVLFCRVGESLYAYGSGCPNCAGALGRAKLEGIDLICPYCGERYDVLRAGRSLDQPHLHLDPIPLLEEGARTRVAIPASSSAG